MNGFHGRNSAFDAPGIKQEQAGHGLALFTAASASCVTGLVVADTWAQWSLMGQVIIITLIQNGGMQMMGAMMISSLIIFPALTSMQVFKSSRAVVWSSGIVAVVCFCIGMTASYRFSTPAGASVVLANLAAFAVFGAVKRVRRKFHHVLS